SHARGTVMGCGNRNVSELLSFQSYGASPLFPPTFNGVGGMGQLRVRRTPTVTTIVLDGIMDVECRLPGLDVPGGTIEGVNLVVPGVANFNKPISGTTLFRKIS